MANEPKRDLEAQPIVAEPDDAQEKLASIGGHRRPGTIFGIRNRESGMRGGGATDYTKRYDKDLFGKEMSSNGRFWLTYANEALIFDEEMVEIYNDDINVLLVFAGLFSAVVSAFVIQSAQSLQPDNTAVSASLLIELVGYQRAASDTSSIPLSPFYPAISFSPSTTDVLVNSLWFISLTLSLITALVAVLTKQWLHQYISVVSDIYPLSQGRIRQCRYMGLEKWQVPMIIGFLPILLHLSLFLFFLGLCIYLFALHAVIAYAVASLSGIVFVAYIVCLVLPLFHYNCPYKTSLTDWMFRAIYGVVPLIYRKDLPRTAREAERFTAGERFKAGGDEERLTARDVERLKAIEALDTEAISWLHSTSSNPSAKQIAFEAALPISLNPWALVCGNAKSIIDEIFKRYTGESRSSPAASEPPWRIYKDTPSSLLAILDLPGAELPEGIWTCLLCDEEWKVFPWTESATQLAAKLMEAWQKGLTSGLSSNVIAHPSNSVEASLQDCLSSPKPELTSALLNGLSIMTHSLFSPSSPGVLVNVMRMFGDQLRNKTNPQNDDHLVHGISDTIDVMEYFQDLRGLRDHLRDRLGDNFGELFGDSFGDSFEARVEAFLEARRREARRREAALQEALQEAVRVEAVCFFGNRLEDWLARIVFTFLHRHSLQADRLQADLQALRKALHKLNLFFDNFKSVTQLLHPEDLQQKTCAQNAFLISSSCIFPKAEKPETRLALLKILSCSVHYTFVFMDPRSQPEIFFTNAIQCFLSNQSEPAHSQHELIVVKMILDPFFDQEYITDRDHVSGPFELKDRGILLKMFREEGGLQALSEKYRALLRSGSATPEVLAPSTGFAHLIVNQMIKTKTFDSLYPPNSKNEFELLFIDVNNLSMLICLLLYNTDLRALQTIGCLLKTLHQHTKVPPQSTWKEFVEQLRQWMADNREELGHLHDIEDIHRLPDLLLEKADFPPELLTT